MMGLQCKPRPPHNNCEFVGCHVGRWIMCWWGWTNIRLPIYWQNANLFPFMVPNQNHKCDERTAAVQLHYEDHFAIGLLIESLRSIGTRETHIGHFVIWSRLNCLRTLWDINIYWIIKRRLLLTGDAFKSTISARDTQPIRKTACFDWPHKILTERAGGSCYNPSWKCSVEGEGELSSNN